MANTYTQIYLHIVFAVKYRQNYLRVKDEELHKYLAGIAKSLNCRLLAANNMEDHIHLLISKSPTISEAELVQKLKANSSRWLKAHLNNNKFQWQKGFGAFSYSPSAIENVKRYIANQQEHHRRKSFREEYLNFLKAFEIKYNTDYLFEFYD